MDPPNNNWRAGPDAQTRPADQWRCCPKYTEGGDPMVHLRKFEDFMRLLNIPNDQASTWFEKTLEGAAQQWWSFLTPAQRQMDTGPQWHEFKLLFRKQFSPGGATREQQESSWEHLAWDGNLSTLQRFAYNLKSVAEGLGYGEPEQVSKFRKCVGKIHTYIIPSLMATDTLLAALNLAIKTIAACGTVNAPQVVSQPPQGQVAANMPFLHAKSISFENNYQDELTRSVDKLGKSLMLYSERMEDIQQSGLDKIFKAIDSKESRGRRGRSKSAERRRNSRGRTARGDSVHVSSNGGRFSSESRERDNGRGRRQSPSPGRGRGGRGDSRGRRARSPFYDQRHCRYCDKIGHTYKFCNKMKEDLVRIKRLTENNDNNGDKTESLNFTTKDRDVIEFMQAMATLN